MATFERRRQYLSAVSQKDYELLGSFKTDVARMEQAERQRAEARAGMMSYKEGVERKLVDIQGAPKGKKGVSGQDHS